MRRAKTIKRTVKCELWQLLYATEQNQWCFMRWFIDLPLLLLQAKTILSFLKGKSVWWWYIHRTKIDPFLVRKSHQLLISFEKHSFSFLWTVVTIFVCLSGALLENVQVKYRSKVVKYTWPMPSQETDYIPWVCVTLANGETLQTKLLVSLILSRNLWLLLCHF